MPSHAPTAPSLLDYDAEAEAYDATRGGAPRAGAAAAALLGRLPASTRTLMDLGLSCGTGIVTARPARPGLRVLGADSPRATAAALLAGQYASRVRPRGTTARELAALLERLPGPDAPRAEPDYLVRSSVRVGWRPRRRRPGSHRPPPPLHPRHPPPQARRVGVRAQAGPARRLRRP
ncbi:hypothetical protein ACFWSR_28445, partial [Streptomyces sp. NPDC058621]